MSTAHWNPWQVDKRLRGMPVCSPTESCGVAYPPLRRRHDTKAAAASAVNSEQHDFTTSDQLVSNYLFKIWNRPE